MTITAPPKVREIVENLGSQSIHPGLRLDRYLIPGKQEAQKESLDDVIRDFDAHRGHANLSALLTRLSALLKHEKATSWTRATATPLTLHLARAGVLENAGILLHRVHGVPYLPGSSLKGLARAFAETVWAPSQPDPAAAWAALNVVFGRAAETDKMGGGKEKPWKPSGVGVLPESAGAIVFHDAWPTSWPQLTVDIVNCHHKKYYQGQEGEKPEPPGDWENPEPSYFLAIKPGASFTFALSGRRPGQDAASLELARVWLDAALTHVGFGAKTAGGYGYFREDAIEPKVRENVSTIWRGALSGRHDQPPRRVESVFHLTLVTPAYLAGASQGKDDCGLTPGTARGLLRYWWRALHAGYLRPAVLRDLESILWGDTRGGGLVQTIVSHIGKTAPEPGVHRGYLNYGMSENRRWLAQPDDRWQLRLIARGRNDNPDLHPKDALDQAHAALWCWSHLGGVGSKCRKGHGSFVLTPSPPVNSLERCEEVAKSIHLWVASRIQLIEDLAKEADTPHIDESPNLTNRIGPREWTFKTKVAADALDFIDQGYRQAAGDLPRADRLALGLPRKGQGRRSSERHASPVHVHVEKDSAGRILVRAVALPSSRLDARSSTNGEVLQQFLERLDAAFKPWLYAPPSPPTPTTPKKIEKGQYRAGVVVRRGDQWTVVFDGETRAVQLARNSISDLLGEAPQDSKVECYILEASKRGIKARIDKFLNS